MRGTPGGIVELVVRRALIVWAAGTLCLLAVGWGAALGLALGGAMSIGILLLYRALVKAWVRPNRWRKGRFVLAGIWLVKWPALGALLYFALTQWRVSALWLCVGVGLVPGITTAIALWALVKSRGNLSAILEME
ncbi:MAG: hypothetical protein JSV79_00540 [Armatimonadota bacterium]|nr:MAG: hypothetical protein JSV79_00540 [Armatimonadota bacterium]